MNKIYKVIFSRRLGAFVVTSELTKAHSKDSNSVDERRGLVDSQSQHGAWLHRALSFLQSPRLSLRPLVVSLLMGISVPAWAASGFILKDGKLVYCSTLSSDGTTCTTTPSVSLSSSDGSTLTWNGSGGFSTAILNATTKVVTPSITLNGKVLGYNSTWAAADGGNTGLSFDGKPITPYYGVNSDAGGGNYYGQGATGAGAIAIGKNASAANKHSIAIGWNAKTVGSSQAHGIAIGGAESPAEAAVAARSSIAMGYNVRLDTAAHSFGFGINLHMGGYRNIAISAAGSFSSPTTVYGYGNTVIGSDNKLDGKNYTEKNEYEYDYKDIASNAVLGESNKIVGTAGANAQAVDYSGTTGAYRNAIVGMNNTLNGNNYFNMLLASGATLATGAHHNTLLGGTITVGTNVNNSFVLGSNATLSNGSHHNTLLGSGNIVNANIRGSYVLGNNVTVAANNSVYFGDASVATLKPTSVNDVDGEGNTKLSGLPYENRDFSTLTLTQLNELITAGEKGQQNITINGKLYNFAGQGKSNGGVISVGGIKVENGKNVSYGRIIQNVAPGLVGANSTDAINGSQLFAIYSAIDATVKQVVSGERGTVVYTTPDGTRLLREGNTLYSQELATGYKRAIDGLWYKTSDFTGEVLTNPNNIFGKTLSELNADRGYFRANDGKWYTQDQLSPEKQSNQYVPLVIDSGLTDEAFTAKKLAEASTTFANLTFDSTQVILSLVNAEKQSDPSTENDATKERTILANLKEALPILGDTDLTAKAKELYLADNNNNNAGWTALGSEGQKTWIAKAASNQAKAAVTALLAKNDVTDAHELSKAATLQDLKTISLAGLDFAGDSGTNVHRNLSQTLAIKGGETAAANLTTLADKNIGVVADGTGSLNVLLAKNLTSLTSVQTVNNNVWQKQTGDNATLTSANSVTKLDQYGLHLGQAGATNTEKASVMLLSPQNSLNDTLINNMSPIFATASNGAWGTGGSSISGGAQNNGANNGYIFGNGALGLLVGSLAEGSKTDFTGGTGQGYAVFLGLRNGVVDVTKTPESKGQPIIYDLSHAETDGKKLLPGKASATNEQSGPIAIGAYNSITGNSGLAVGSLNRVYGNGGVVVGTTSVADAYSSVGRFGVTMGFNVKNGEWSQQSVAIGANLQAVGSGNIILGGGTDKYYGANYWQGADGQVETTTNGVYTTLGNVFTGSLSNAGMRFFGDRNIVLGAKNRTEGFNPNVGGQGYSGNAGNGSYTRIADNAITGANNSIRDLSFRNSVYGSNNIVTAGIDNMIIGSGNDIQAAYNGTLNYDGGGSASGVVKDAQTIGNLWRVSTTGSGSTIKANTTQLLYGDSNSIIGSRNTIGYNTGHNFLAGADNTIYENSLYNFLAGSRNIAGSDLLDLVKVKEVADKLKISYAETDSVDTILNKIKDYQLSVGDDTTGLNLLAGSYNVAGKGSSNNVVQGSNVIIRNNVKGSYVLGSHVDVAQSNSVYIGDSSVATLKPTAVSDVENGKTKEHGDVPDFSTLSLNELNTLITAGERGQQSITINGKTYNFAGLGKENGGVISVGGIRVKDGKNVSYGRIIQNVAPGLVGANSTDAINGSQLYAIYSSIDATVKQVVSGEQGPVVYTDSSGNRLLQENNIFYKPTLADNYKRAIDGLWYKTTDFKADGTLENPNNIFGKTLADLNTNGEYYQANDGKWYTRDQLKNEKYNNQFVPLEEQTGLNASDFATTKTGFSDYTFDSEDTILSLVNAEKQANSTTAKDATKERTILANLKEALPILGDTDLMAKAKALYIGDNTNNTDTSWTDLGTEGQKTWIAKAASEQAKIAVTDLLAKADRLTKDGVQVANHELGKAATLQDLKTLSLAGLDFAGDSGKNVHRNLSETLTIKGGLTNASKLSDNNIGVVANGTDALVVKLAKDIVGLGSTNYGTVTTGTAPNTTTNPFTGFTDYMASAINPKANVSGTDLFLGSNRAHYTASLDNTGLHLGSGTTEKATVALINPQNSLNPDSSADGLSVIFTSANNGGTPVSPTDERDTTKAAEVRTAYDGKIFGNAPLGLLVGTMAEGSSSTMQGSTGTGFGVFVGFNNGVVPVTSASNTAFEQPTIFKGVTATRSETGNVQNAGGSSAVVFGAFNSISGNGGLAVGTLNRVYGNEGIVVGNTTLANSYSSVGRFGVTMGFNVKAGEWSKQSVVIGSNMQAVGAGNIILGGGENKFYGAGSGWADVIDGNGIYTTLANTFDATPENLNNSGMRFWGDRNIVIGAKNRTEGFNTDFTSSGYIGSTGNGGYQRIADNSVVGTNNTLYDLSKTNSVYGSNNVIASGTNNMVIGSNNRVQAQLGSTTITGAITGRSQAETAAIAALGNVALDATGKPRGLTYGDNNTIIGSRNTVAYNTGHNFLAGADNIVEANSMYNFLAGSKNISGVDLTNSTAVRGAVTNLFGTNPNISTNNMEDATAIANDLGLVQKFNLSTLLAKSNAQTGMNLLAGSFNIAGVGTSNNVVEGSNVILRNNVKSTYVLGSHIDADQSNSVYIGDYSVATTTPLSTTKGKYDGKLSDLPKNGTDAVITDGVTTTPAVIGLNDLMTAGSTGQTSISINGKTYNFAGVGKTTETNQRTIANDVGTITVGRIVQETDANGNKYNKSYGRVIQNVAPGLVGANSTDAINGSQLYAIWDAMESSVARVVTGLDGNIVYTSGEGHRLYSWNNTLYDSALVDGKFKQAANGQWYPVAAFDTQNGNQLKTAFSGSNGFTLGEINQAKTEGSTLTVKGKDGVEATSTAWLKEGSATEHDTTSAVVGANSAVLSLVDGSQSTTSNIELYNVANALSLPAAGTTTQSQQQVAVSKLLKGQNASGGDLSAYDFSQATNLKDLQNLALAGMDFTGDTLPKNAVSEDKVTVHRNLSEALKITGGVTDVSKLSTGDNIGVIASNKSGSLTLRLATDLKELTSTEYTTTTANGTTTTKITSSGVTIQGPTPANGTAPDPISMTTSGINAGNTSITKVKSGLAANSTTIDNTNSTYGATLGDVQKLVNAAAWDIGQTTTTTTTGPEGSSTTSSYSSTGTVNNAERVSFDAGTGTTVTLTKTEAVTSGDNQKPETYSVVFAVKTQELERNSTTGAVTIKSGGDAGGYATAENIQNILDGMNTSLTSATFGLADSNNGTVTKKLNNTIQVTGYDSNITTEVAKSSAQASANDVLKIKLNPTVTLGDTATGDTAGSLVVKNAGAADQASAIKLSNGQITFRSNAMSSGVYTDYVLSLVSGTKIPGTTGTNSARLSFNGNQLATLTDGIAFSGDQPLTTTNEFTAALNNKVKIEGGYIKKGQTIDDDLTTTNIGVISNGTDQLSIRLAKDLTHMTSAEFIGNAGTYLSGETSINYTPSVKLSVVQGIANNANNGTSVLYLSGPSVSSGDGSSTPSLVRIDGVFTDHITNDGTFTTKGDNEVVTVGELRNITLARDTANTVAMQNLYYGFRTGGSGSYKYASRNLLGSKDDATLPDASFFVPIKGDSGNNIQVSISGSNSTDPKQTNSELTIGLNKDVKLGNNTQGSAGSLTIDGDNSNESISLNGAQHTLVIKAPQEIIDEGGTSVTYPSSEFTLDGRKGKLTFGGDPNTATFIDFANTTTVNDLSGTELKRIVVGTSTNNAPVATMKDGLKFTGNNNDNISRVLNETLHVVGGATVTGTEGNNTVQQSDINKATTDKNTYVAVEEYDTGRTVGTQQVMDKRLVIRLAKELTDLNTMTLGGQALTDGGTASKVKLSTAEAVTVNVDTTNAKTYSVLQLGNENGDPALLRNLAEGIDDTDAVTVSQLKNAAWTIGTVSGDNTPSTTVNNGDVVNFANGTGTTANVAVSTIDGKDTYTVKFNIDKGSITSDGTTGVASTDDSENKFVDSKTVVDAITKAVAGATQKYTADNKAGDPPANVTITRKTGETIGLIGGATGTLTDNNIGTVANATDNTIAIKLAKNLTGLESTSYTTTSGSNTYTTMINSQGVTITPPAATGSNADLTKIVSLTDTGLNNGGNRITGLTSPLTGLSTVADATHTHTSYDGLSPAFLTTLRDLGVDGDGGTKTDELLKEERAKLASAATVGDLQNLSNMPIYFSADNYQDKLDDAVVPVKLGEQLSIETGKFVMKLKSMTDNTYDISTYDASNTDAYNDENMAAVVKDGGILLGFRNTPIFTGLRIGIITTNQDGTTKENSVAIANTTDYSQTDVKPTLKIGGDKAVRITNIASPESANDAVNKAYVDAAKSTVTTSGAAILTTTSGDNGSVYNIHVDKWLSYVDGSGNNLTNVIKGDDNKYYQASALAGLKYNTTTQQWTKENGDPISAQPTAIDKAVAKLTTFGTVTPVLSNVAKGQIDKDSVDAINGSQLKQLVEKLGLSVSNDKTEITGTFNSVNAGGGSTTAPDSVVNAINQLTTAVNKGRVYAGDDYVAAIGNGETEQNAIKRELGERINIKGGADSTTLANLSDGNIGVIANSSADTLTVKLAKQLKGLTDITFGTDATSSSVADKTVINKDGISITQGTTVIKFTDNGISAGGQAITNVKDAITGVSEQDIQNKALALYNAENPNAQKTTFTDIPSAVKDSYKTRATEASNKTVVGNMLTTSGDVLKQATTLYDLQRVANAGLDFVGNNSGTIVHRPLSSTLNIVGEGDYSAVTADKPFQSAAGNIYIQGFNTTADGFKLVAKLAKDLQNLNSATFSTIENSKTYTTVVNGKGNTITTTGDNIQTVATSTSTGTTYETLQTITNEGNTSVVPSAPKVEVSNKGITITKLVENGKDDTDGTKDGYNSNNTVSLTENGLNNGGNKISNVAKGSEDSDVATIAQLKDGTAAATTKVTGSGAAVVTSTTARDKSTTYNVHVEKVLSYTDASGKELVQAADGKYYTATDINGLVYDGTTWKKADGTELSEEEKPVAQTATTAKLADVTSDKAPILSNINDGAITANSTDAINGSQLYSLEKDVLGFKEGTGNDAGKLVNPTFTAVTAGGTGTTANTTAPTTIVDAIEQLTTAANKGRVYAGDGLDAETLQANASSTTDTDKTNAFTRQLGETLNIKGGVTDPVKLSDGNIGVVSNGVDTLTVKLAKELKDLTSAQFVHKETKDGKTITHTTTTTGDGTTITTTDAEGNKTTSTATSTGTTYAVTDKNDKATGPKTEVTNGGITITPKKDDGSYDSDKVVSLTENGLNNGGNKITNVADGAISESSTDVVTGKQLYNVQTKAAADAKAARTQVTGSGGAIVTKQTSASGQDTYNVHVDQPAVYVDVQGNKLVKGADGKWHTEDSLKGLAYVPGANGGGTWLRVGEDGSLTAIAAENAPAEVPPAAMKLVNADGSTTQATTLGNVASAIGGNSSDGSFITNLNKVGMTGEGAIDGNTAVTTQDLKNLANAGFKLQTNSGSAQTIQLGDTIQVVDGANTKVSAITSANGVHTYSINVDGLPMAFKDAAGNTLVKVGNNFYKASDIGTDGKLKDKAQVATPTEVTLLGKDGNPTAQKLGGINSSVNDVTALNDPSNANSGAKDNATFADKLATAAANDNLKNSAVNVSDLNEVSKAAANAQATADKGFNIKTSADGGVVNNSGIATSGDNIKPGNTLEFVAGENVTLDQSSGKIKISTNDQNIVNNTQLPIAYVTDVTTKGADGKDVITPTKVYKGADGKFYTDKTLAQRISADGKLNGQDLTAAQSATRFDASKVYTAIQNANGTVDKTSVLANVADGRIAYGSKEAINGGQLFDLQEYLGVTVINNNTHVDNSTTTVNELNPVEIKEYSYVNENNEKVTVRVPLDESNKPYLKTYNVDDNGEYITNNIYSAVRNINEQGTKYFHVNAGQEIPEAQITNSDDSSASASRSTAIGYQSSVGSGASNSLAVGTQNEVGKDASDALAIGSSATVIQDSDNAIAIGKEGTVAGSNTISVGTGHIVAGDNSGAIGDPTKISAKSSYSVGNNNSIGEEGIGDEDIISQIEAKIAERKKLIRPTLPALEANPTDAQLKDYQAKLAIYQTDLADYLKQKEELATEIKNLSAQVTTENVMAMGNDIKVGANANNAVAVGTKVTVTKGASHAVAVGTSATVKATNGVAIGNSASVEAENGVALGNKAKVTTKNSVAVGAGAEATQTLEQLQAAKPFGIESNPYIVGYGEQVVGEVSVGRMTESGEQEVRRITNVAAGSAPTDAVNVSQLYGLGAQVNKQFNQINNRIDGLSKDIDASTATAAAMANLPQAYMPGKSMVAMGTGFHRGQQAIAIGVSRISDNGKLIIKGSLSHSSRNNTTFGAGIGYQW